MNDPTYVTEEIDKNPEWKLAFYLSEVDNDNAPLGWFHYVPMAKYLLSAFDITPKDETR